MRIQIENVLQYPAEINSFVNISENRGLLVGKIEIPQKYQMIHLDNQIVIAI